MYIDSHYQNILLYVVDADGRSSRVTLSVEAAVKELIQENP